MQEFSVKTRVSLLHFFESGFTNDLMELAEKGEVRLVYV